MLHDRALVLTKPHNPKFKSFDGWVWKFICHHNLVLWAHTSVAQKLLKDLEEKIAAFYTEVKTKRQKYDYPKDLIGNMDETPVDFDV